MMREAHRHQPLEDVRAHRVLVGERQQLVRVGMTLSDPEARQNGDSRVRSSRFSLAVEHGDEPGRGLRPCPCTIASRWRRASCM